MGETNKSTNKHPTHLSMSRCWSQSIEGKAVVMVVEVNRVQLAAGQEMPEKWRINRREGRHCQQWVQPWSRLAMVRASCLGGQPHGMDVVGAKKWLEEQWQHGKSANKTPVPAVNALVPTPAVGLVDCQPWSGHDGGTLVVGDLLVMSQSSGGARVKLVQKCQRNPKKMGGS